MVYRVERSVVFEKDLDAIYKHLYSTSIAFGNSVERAAESARDRLLKIENDIEALSRKPHQGTLRPELGPNRRNVTKRNVVIYFKIDDETRTVSLIAAFFGGQDHLRHMRNRNKT